MSLIATETEFIELPGFIVHRVGGIIYIRDPDKKTVCFLLEEMAEKYPSMILQIQETAQAEREKKLQ